MSTTLPAELQISRHDSTLVLSLRDPASRNALSPAIYAAAIAALDDAARDPTLRAIVLTGAGSAFCAGADLKSPPGQVVDGQQSVSLATVLALMQDGAKPVIAAINGAAFAGGLGLVGASDLVVTVDDAPFSFSEVKIGVIPAVISVVCLPKLGPLHGMKLFLTGERFSGRQAVGYGLAHQAVPADQLQATVDALVATLSAGGPIAVGECKKLVQRIPTLARDAAFAEASAWSARMFRSPEAAEGMAAFREKRKPNWIKA